MSTSSTPSITNTYGRCGRTSAQTYGEAKSRQDIAGALEACTADFVIETVPFGTVARGRDEVAYDLGVFFEMFPDYEFHCEGTAVSNDGSVVVWGRACMTWSGRLPSLVPGAQQLPRLARRRIDVPATAVYDVRDGLLARERFVFDMDAFCRQLGMPTVVVRRLLRAVERRRIRDVRGVAAASEIVIENSAIVRAPMQRVFERGFEDVSALMAGNLSFPVSAKRISLVGDRLGVGAIRRVELTNGHIMDEVIEEYSPPHRLSYRIADFGAPLNHLASEGRGTHTLEALGPSVTRATWRAHVVPRSAIMRPLARLATRLLDRVQRRFHAALETIAA